MTTQQKTKKFRRRVEVGVDPATFAKWDVSIPPNCAAISRGGVVIANNNPASWIEITVFTPRHQQLFDDVKQIEINEKIQEIVLQKAQREKEKDA